ncbi:MAG: LysR family transcriptional regulator [Ruminococcaceae bacterium]|nr:LysR family transcriptional regulator [Oscillospiraceae bacterium]
MSITKYEALLKTAELGSLTKAAEVLGVTQSGVSHMINGLESELGFSLMIRTRGGARLTAEGEQLLPYIRRIITSQNELLQAASSIRGTESGSINIATFTSVAVHWLPGIIKSFEAKFPNVELILKNGDYHDVEGWLEDGSADIGFITMPASVRGKVIALHEDRVLAVLPKEHRYAKMAKFPLAEAANEPFIGLLESSDHDARRALSSAGISPNIKFTTKDDYAIIAMVENGLGISIMPELLLEGRKDRVAALPLVPPSSRTIALCLPRGDKAGPAALRFATCTSAWVKERYKSKH